MSVFLEVISSWFEIDNSPKGKSKHEEGKAIMARSTRERRFFPLPPIQETGSSDNLQRVQIGRLLGIKEAGDEILAEFAAKRAAMQPHEEVLHNGWRRVRVVSAARKW